MMGVKARNSVPAPLPGSASAVQINAPIFKVHANSAALLYTHTPLACMHACCPCSRQPVPNNAENGENRSQRKYKGVSTSLCLCDFVLQLKNLHLPLPYLCHLDLIHLPASSALHATSSSSSSCSQQTAGRKMSDQQQAQQAQQQQQQSQRVSIVQQMLEDALMATASKEKLEFPLVSKGKLCNMSHLHH